MPHFSIGFSRLNIRFFPTQNTNDVHCAVADITEHIHTLEIGEPVSHGSKALREHIDAYYLNRVIGVAERELN